MTHDELLETINAEIHSCEPHCMSHIVENRPWKALRAVLEIRHEDARMAKFKAQDFQDGYSKALDDVLQAIEKELSA